MAKGPHLKIMEAAHHKEGLTLGAEEVERLALDPAVWTAAYDNFRRDNGHDKHPEWMNIINERMP